MLSKTQLIEKLAASSDGLTKRGVKDLLQTLTDIAHKELKKTGSFVVPGLAKFVVVKKPATKARKGINPFTKEPTVFKAKPARKQIKIRAVKAAKDALL
jgi:DNA-binding protein HU-beta